MEHRSSWGCRELSDLAIELTLNNLPQVDLVPISKAFRLAPYRIQWPNSLVIKGSKALTTVSCEDSLNYQPERVDRSQLIIHLHAEGLLCSKICIEVHGEYEFFVFPDLVLKPWFADDKPSLTVDSKAANFSTVDGNRRNRAKTYWKTRHPLNRQLSLSAEERLAQCLHCRNLLYRGRVQFSCCNSSDFPINDCRTSSANPIVEATGQVGYLLEK